MKDKEAEVFKLLVEERPLMGTLDQLELARRITDVGLRLSNLIKQIKALQDAKHEVSKEWLEAVGGLDTVRLTAILIEDGNE